MQDVELYLTRNSFNKIRLRIHNSLAEIASHVLTLRLSKHLAQNGQLFFLGNSDTFPSWLARVNWLHRATNTVGAFTGYAVGGADFCYDIRCGAGGRRSFVKKLVNADSGCEAVLFVYIVSHGRKSRSSSPQLLK